MHVLIAEDETPARAELHFILATLLPAATFHEAANGREALAKAAQIDLDVAFLDINMPGINGLDVAAALLEDPNPPAIVFATAYDEHALAAFDLAALDYVLKPFDERRLAQTVARIQRLQTEKSLLQQQHDLIRSYLHDALPSTGPNKLWGERANENRVPVDYADILWLEAADKRVYMVTANDEKLLVRKTLKELEVELGAHRFVRVHKAYIVNLDHVAEAVPWFATGYLMRMDNTEGSEIPVSRRYATRLKKETGLF